MKKSLVLLVSAFLVLQTQVSASTVSQATAQTIANNFFKATVPSAASATLTLTLSYTQTESDGSVDFYVFNVSPVKGFVIVAADNNASPVLAYSTESDFPANIPAVAGISDWVKSAGTRVHYIVTNNILANANIQNAWAAYAAGQNPNTSRSGAVGPLLTTTWNQAPYYNALCPPAATASTSSTKAVTGCVATAMAQVMKYWNYPAKGTGSNTYNDNQPQYSENYGTLTADFTRPLYWSAMGAYTTSNTSPIDTLMYELGVAVDMDYDPSGSGAYVLTSEGTPCAQSVYVTNFFYDPNTIQGVHLSQYTDAAWIALMENEINSGRVVQYEGDDATQGGHTWVMDGYTPSVSASGGALLHMNWGWGGAYDGNFDVTNLTTGTGASAFNPVQNDAALIGIQPIPAFNISLTPTSAPTVCPSSNGVTLNVAGPASASYTWSPSTGLSCTNCANPLADPYTTTLYTVVADSAGVTVNASIVVNVTSAATAAFNYNVTASCNLPQNVAFTNSSSNATSYLWDFGDGTTSTAASPVHPYTAVGNYTATLVAINACGADSIISNQAIPITGGAPVVPDQSICSGQTANLNAAGTGVSWYSDPQGVNIVEAGNDYVTSPLSANATFYVGSSVNPAATAAGPANDGIGGGGNYAQPGLHGLLFNSTVAQTLTSVVVYSNSAQTLTFALYDSTGTTVITSASESLIAGEQTVQLNFLLPAGTTCMLAINGTANLYRNNTGAAFPYVSADGTLSITGNNLNASGHYYYFYDWQLQQATCNSALAPVNVWVLNAGGGAFTATGTGSTTVNFTPQNQSATSYEWNFGDGQTSTSMTPTHVYAGGGTYTVQLIESNGSCSDTINQTINTNVLGVSDLTSISGISVSPNPATSTISLNLNSANQISGCQIRVSNLLGQTESTTEVNVNSGSNKFNIDISNLTTGVYFLTFSNGKDVVTSKFVKGE